MSLFNRLLLGIYSLCVAVLSVILGLVVVGWTTPLEFLQMALVKQDQRIGLGLLALAFASVSVKFLVNSLGTKAETPHALIRDTDVGQVRITLQALENLVRKTAGQIRGVREVKPRIFSRPDGIGVFIHVVVAPDLVVPELSEELQVKVKESLEQVAGVNVGSIRVLVENISTETKVKDKVF